MWTNFFLILCLIGCASGTKNPLKNSKKLIKEGHASLYKNGAFAIPFTKIKLIPPGPDALEFAKELSGMRAKESFVRYLNEVKGSTVQIFKGTKSSYKLAKDVDQTISLALADLAPKMKKESVIVMDASFALSQKIFGESWKAAKKESFIQKKQAQKIKDESNVEFKQEPFKGGEDFILAYVQLPATLKKRGQGIGEAASLERFVETFRLSNELREEYSNEPVYLIKDSFKNYGKDVDRSLTKAKNSLSESADYGVSLPFIQSVSWLVEGILWQGVIKPLGKLTAGAIGYTFVNGIAYPTFLVMSSGVTTSLVAIEVTKETGYGIYNITAPTVELALSGIFYSGEFLLKKVSEKSVQGAGLLVGNSLEYIGAPVSKALISTGGTITGVAVGVGGGVLAGSLRGTSELLTLSSQVISKTAAAGVLTTGVVVHTLKGTAEVVYEITKASVVPPSMVLGSGLTLSYGTVSQIAAQSVLAVSDAAYLVLSMEGPQWVIYSVTGGTLDEEIPANALVDLEKLKDSGAVIRRVPMTEKNIQEVLKQLNEN